MRKIRVQETVPSEMCHRPDGIWFRRIVRGDVRVHAIISLQTVGTHTSVGTSHQKLEIDSDRESGDSPLRAHAR